MKFLGVICSLVHKHRWHEALAISSGEDQSSTPEGGSLSCLGFPNALACEELEGYILILTMIHWDQIRSHQNAKPGMDEAGFLLVLWVLISGQEALSVVQ